MTKQEVVQRILKSVQSRIAQGVAAGRNTQWQVNQYLDGQLMIIGLLYTEVPSDSDAAANLDILVQLISEIRILVNPPPFTK